MKSLYVVASYVKRPQNPHLTSKPGYLSHESNFSYDEKVQIVSKIKSRDLQMCQVILDMGAKKVVKNSFSSDKTYDELIKYYVDNYDQYFRDTLRKLIPNVDAEPVPAVPPKAEETIHRTTASEPNVASEGTATN